MVWSSCRSLPHNHYYLFIRYIANRYYITTSINKFESFSIVRTLNKIPESSLAGVRSTVISQTSLFTNYIMLRGSKTSFSTDFERKCEDTNDLAIVDIIKTKLRNKRVKVATIISYCENVDRNGDYLIHFQDLQSILNHALGSEAISAREMQHLVKLITPSRRSEPGIINYRKFLDLFSDSLSKSKTEHNVERWDYEDNEEERNDGKWASKKGSVGEWLKNAACPAEVANFRKLIASLEEFERSSGMKCIKKENGFVVPLGPDLKASISFYMD